MPKKTDKLYPDLSAVGGLVKALQNELTNISSSLKVASLTDVVENLPMQPQKGFPTFAQVEHGDRMSQIFIAAGGRLFLFDFWRKGVMLANAETSVLADVARSLESWIMGCDTTEELKEKFLFVEVKPDADCFEKGEEVEMAWEKYRSLIPITMRNLLEFFELARNTPQLRQLFPYTSMYYFCFSRCTGYPYSYDCPSVMALKDETYQVSMQGRIIGEGNAHEAIQIVLKHLPEGCGLALPGTADDL